jgi:integrase/recombinase XerD
MTWEKITAGYRAFLKLEKSLSANSIEAYMEDLKKLTNYFQLKAVSIPPEEVEYTHLKEFIVWLNELGISPRSQARIISGLKSFFRYLMMEDRITKDPTELLESPRLGRKLPDVLSVPEIDRIIAAIDLSKPEGHRNKAIIETLYSCGLRVSELTDLRMTNLYFSEEFIKVLGKGSKERLVPISARAIKEIRFYLEQYRRHLIPKKGSENILFLNRRGSKMTRVMIFTLTKQLTEKSGIRKNVSPHTFRHSFATHLVDGGADLRAVQEMLGHESILTTEIYTHLDREYLRDAIMRHHPRSKHLETENRLPGKSTGKKGSKNIG